ncbi:TonB-dependent receptor [Chitinophaga sp.]|uniref:TonB-dependent receptor n=1 Tax=Chitinophaga sp. TaxID=1869181 RepID=UPI0031DB4801
MKLFIPLFLLMLITQYSYGQTGYIAGKIIDQTSLLPVSGVTVVITPGNLTDISDEGGRFSFKQPSGQIKFSAIGYEEKTIHSSDIKKDQAIVLVPKTTLLSDVVVSAANPNPYKAIGETDIKTRGITNSQEVLRIIPGLFIGQHQGGGKAEQIFARGLDNDHGTDIRLSVDGMAINMVSHAHGQGYADSHFIIPETIESTTYKKGMYDAQKGDLAVTGFADFHTINAITNNLFRLEGGQYNTYRVLGMVNLLGEKAKTHNQSWYAASEYRYSDSYFDNPQHFNRFNFFTKYHGQLNTNNWFTLSASTLYSKWNASGQIPDYAVTEGITGFYGELDPDEGGKTTRTNVNAALLTTLSNHDMVKNQLYYTRYTFDLYSNFTFYLEDTVNGDEIHQAEGRNLVGYNGSYVHEGYLGNAKIITDAGINARYDGTQNTELSHVANRYTLLDRIQLGDITEFSAGAYVNETLQFSQHFTMNAGLRFDQFFYKYNNKLDSVVSTANNNTVSPKLNFYYQPTKSAQVYLFLGKGFHSNDTRVVVTEKNGPTLPAAYGADLGTVLKPTGNLVISGALWYSYLQKEYVYAGDGGSVEFSGRTRRIGGDLSVRYQPISPLYVDVDVNYARGRSLDDPKGENYIPLAPVWSSTGGVAYSFKNGFNGSLRYRWLGNRPANEDYSLIAKGYFVNDMVINYTKKKFEVGITVNNLFNVQWKETQFETTTRLKGQEAVNSIAFTAGSKFAAIAHVSYFFR